MRMVTKEQPKEEVLKEIVIAYDAFLYNEYEERVDDLEEMLNDVQSGKSVWYSIASTNAEYDDDMMFDAEINFVEMKVRYSVRGTVVKEDKFDTYHEMLMFVKYASFDELVSDDNFPGYSKYED